MAILTWYVQQIDELKVASSDIRSVRLEKTDSLRRFLTSNVPRKTSGACEGGRVREMNWKGSGDTPLFVRISFENGDHFCFSVSTILALPLLIAHVDHLRFTLSRRAPGNIKQRQGRD